MCSMRTICISSPSVSLEWVREICDEIEASTPIADPSRVYVVVNRRALGPVPRAVWARCRAVLEATTDRFVLEQGYPEDADTLPPPANVSAQSGTRLRRVSLRALVVVHVELVRASIVAALREHGIDAIGVADGASAVLELRSRPHDALVADFALPIVSGVELVSWARRELDVGATALVAADKPRCFIPDCDDADIVLGAPLDPAELAALVRAQLTHAEASSRATR